MKTEKEKKIEIALLKEKLERVSGQKVLFKEENTKTKITLNSDELVKTWNNIVSGQISDGKYENSNNTDWLWRDVVVTKGDKNKIEVSPWKIGKRNYSFTDLIPILGLDDMLEDSGYKTEKDLKKALSTISTLIRDGKAPNFEPVVETYPEKKDFERAKGLSFSGSTFYGNGAPFTTSASKMAKLITDPNKLIRRAKAVVATWGTGDYVGISGGVSGKKIEHVENVWKPFKERLNELNISSEEIKQIENFKIMHKESRTNLRKIMNSILLESEIRKLQDRGEEFIGDDDNVYIGTNPYGVFSYYYSPKTKTITTYRGPLKNGNFMYYMDKGEFLQKTIPISSSIKYLTEETYTDGQSDYDLEKEEQEEENFVDQDYERLSREQEHYGMSTESEEISTEKKYIAIITWKEEGEEMWDVASELTTRDIASEGVKKALKTWKKQSPETYNEQEVKGFVISEEKYNEKLKESGEENIITEEVIEEMAYGDQYDNMILDYVKDKGDEGAVAKELIALFPNQTVSIPVLQRLVKTGKVVRDMTQKPGRWYTPETAPEGFEAKEVERSPRMGKKFTEEDIKTIMSIVKDAYKYSGEFESDIKDEGIKLQVEFFSGYRGPRTDHGGGRNGEDWMSNSQIEKERQRAVKSLDPSIKRAKEYFKNKGIKIEKVYVDYGEKGHVYINYTLTK